MENHFGPDVAARYDQGAPAMFAAAAIDPVVDRLAGLAGGGPALELAIGTGRIALPLAARGVEVHGIDLSPDMVQQLRAKPGGDRIPVTIGDFATTTVGSGFRLAYLVWNTIMNVTTQEGQVDVFRSVAAQLAPGGCFVVEVGVPGLRLLPPGQTVVPFELADTHWGFDRYDTSTQSVSSYHAEIDGEQGAFRAVPFRYAWPAELDLMARLAGMRLRDRWSGWRGEPFTHESTQHVSVWQQP